MTTEFVPQPDDEIPAQKQYTVDLSLKSLVGTMSDRASTIATALSTPPPEGQTQRTDLHPDLAPHLQKIAELSQQLQAELDAIAEIDPETFAKLKQS
jgi:hypothetical protein